MVHSPVALALSLALSLAVRQFVECKNLCHDRSQCAGDTPPHRTPFFEFGTLSYLLFQHHQNGPVADAEYDTVRNQITSTPHEFCIMLPDWIESLTNHTTTNPRNDDR
jgi:hypothetical protein